MIYFLAIIIAQKWEKKTPSVSDSTKMGEKDTFGV